MNLQALREETRVEHEATEALLPLTTPGLDREQYGRILQCFHAMLHGWETWAAAHAPGRLAEVVAERRRSPLLLRDLHFFGLPSGRAPGPETLFPVFSDKQNDAEQEAVFLGSMYVIEGSTLGGQYIARYVEEHLGLQPGEGDAYFRGHGEQTGAMWNSFRELLRAIPDEQSPAVIAAAKDTFAYVQETMRCCSAGLHAEASPAGRTSGSV